MRVGLSLAMLLAVATSAIAQQVPPATDTRAQVHALRFPPLRFNAPQPKRVALSNGVPVYLVEDHTLPLLEVQIRSTVGAAHVPDSLWGIGFHADVLLRTGGTTRLNADSVDMLIEFYGLGIGFVTLPERSYGSIQGLSRYTDQMLDLGFEMMRTPRNDTSRVRVTAEGVREGWRRRNDEPGGILDRAWNQVMLGDHPLGRELVKPDEIAAFTPQRFRWIQERVFCPQNLLIGVSGDFRERDLIAKLERVFRGWPRCKPGLREVPPVQYTQGPRLVLVDKDVNQTSIRIGHASGIRVGDTPDYFATRVANFLLGGSGFTSRLLGRVRSDSGFAYSAFSSWGAHRSHEAEFIAGAQIRAEKTVAGIELMRSVIASMAIQPVTAADVKLAQDYQTNRFVFGFQSPGQIIAQQLSYAADGLPANWFDVYLRGIQAVTPDQVRQVVERYLHPDKLVIVVVGKSAAFDRPLSELGQVTVLPVDSIKR